MTSLAKMGLMILVCFALVLALTGEGFSYQKVEMVSVEQLNAILGGPNLAVIDVRTGIDWSSSEWKIRGAVREDPLDVDTWSARFPKDETLVIYCA